MNSIAIVQNVMPVKLSRHPLLLELANAAADDLHRLVGGEGIFRACESDHALTITQSGMTLSLLVGRVWEEENCAWIGVAWTMPNYRRMGLYSQLLRHYIRWARERSFSSVRCGLSPLSHGSLTVHTRAGLRPTMLEVQL